MGQESARHAQAFMLEQVAARYMQLFEQAHTPH